MDKSQGQEGAAGGTSTRPYLIRALHDWCTDNGFTPYLAVFVDRSVQVPFEYVKNNEIVLNVGWFPHSVMQQARTHRVGVSFDVQSMRYTGERICRAANGELELEEVFYLWPEGNYSDRQGKKYAYTAEQRQLDLDLCRRAAERYRDMLAAGFAEEHARGILPFDYRQHFVVSFSLRAFLHFMDLRAKLDAQEEIRVLCDLMWPHMQAWAPEIAAWYEKSRLHKARLAP